VTYVCKEILLTMLFFVDVVSVIVMVSQICASDCIVFNFAIILTGCVLILLIYS